MQSYKLKKSLVNCFDLSFLVFILLGLYYYLKYEYILILISTSLVLYINIYGINLFIKNLCKIWSIILFQIVFLYVIINFDINLNILQVYIMYIFLIIKFFTLSIIRYNILYDEDELIHNRLIDYIYYLILNPKLLILIITSNIINFIIRLIIFKIFIINISIILIILSILWLPSLFIAHILCSKFKYNLNIDMFFKNININNYNNFWKIILIMQSLKLIFFTLLFINFNDLSIITKHVQKQFDIKCMNNKPLKASLSVLYVPIGLLLNNPQLSMYDNLTVFDPNKRILNTNLWIDESFLSMINHNNIWKEINEMRLWNILYVQFDDNFYKYSAVKRLANNCMKMELDSFVMPIHRSNYISKLEHPTLVEEILSSEIFHRTRENYTYGFMVDILKSYFTKDKGFIVIPQGTNTSDFPDFTIKKDDFFFGCAESKPYDFNFFDTYGQIIHCLKNNTGTMHAHEYSICIINIGTTLTFGIFIPGIHSALGFKNKSVFVDGYLGLTVDKNLKVSIVKQVDIFGPQHATFQLNKDSGQNNKINALFSYLSNIEDLILYFKNHVWSNSFGLKSKMECNINSYVEELKTDQLIIWGEDDTKFKSKKARFIVESDGITHDIHSNKTRFIVESNGTTHDLYRVE